jgi:hypothetical protein
LATNWQREHLLSIVDTVRHVHDTYINTGTVGLTIENECTADNVNAMRTRLVMNNRRAILIGLILVILDWMGWETFSDHPT